MKIALASRIHVYPTFVIVVQMRNALEVAIHAHWGNADAARTTNAQKEKLAGAENAKVKYG